MDKHQHLNEPGGSHQLFGCQGLLHHGEPGIGQLYMWAAIGGAIIMLAVTFTCGCIKCNNMDQATPALAPVAEVNVAVNNLKKIQNTSSAHFRLDNIRKSWRFSFKQKKPQIMANPTPSPTPDTKASINPTTTTSLKPVRPAPLAIQHQANEAITMEDQTIKTIAVRPKKKGMNASQLKASFRE